MLPYGALWKLDEMLHPTAPHGRRTAAERRRQALFLFVCGVVVCSLFLIPYHVTHLRRLSFRKVDARLGLTVDYDVFPSVAESRMRQLNSIIPLLSEVRPNTPLSAATAQSLASEWRKTFYFDSRASAVPRLHGFLTDAYTRQIAGIVFARGLVPSHTGTWSRPTEEAPSRTSRLQRDAFLPTLSESTATQRAGCVRGILSAASVSPNAITDLFASLVSAPGTTSRWTRSDLLTFHSTKDADAPPAWARTELFLEELLKRFGDKVHVVPCAADAFRAEAMEARDGSATASGFCLCACPNAVASEGPWRYSLVRAASQEPTDTPSCLHACACG